jgi:hypothetical protein
MKKEKNNNNLIKYNKKALFILGGAFLFLILFFSNIFFSKEVVYERGDLKAIAIDSKSSTSTTLLEESIKKPKEVVHLKTPKPLKAIYMSSCVVGTKNFRNDLVKVADETEINSIVIDIKDYSGLLSFDTDNPEISHAVSDKCGAKDMKEFIEGLHQKNIYVIGRVAVFQDPHMVKTHPELAVRRKSDGGIWKDRKGLSFIDVGARPHWDYIANIAKESYGIGFDEINFDYVRFPSDGDMKDIDFTLSRGKTKAEVLKEFFSYLHDSLKDTGMITSVDLFGMTTTNFDDLNIGQVEENALPFFDYVAPMVYPSHFPPMFNGWKNPNEHVYELIKYTMTKAVERAEASTSPVAVFGSTRLGTSTPALYSKPIYDRYKLRPWLQDFKYGGNYGPEEVRAQIKATYDSGLDSWMLWAPSNRYTVSALLTQ